MAISREEFDADSVDLAVPVRQVLEEHRTLALDAQMVRELLERTKYRAASYEEVILVLDRLVEFGVAESKILEGARWYTIAISEPRRRLGFGQQEQ